MIIAPIVQTTEFDQWLSTLPDNPPATHRIRLRIEVDVEVVLPPWVSAYDGMRAVGNVASRLDPEDVLSRIDYQTDQFLPSSAKLHDLHGDVETLTTVAE